MQRPPPFEREELLSASEPLFTQSREVRFQEVDAALTIYFPRVLEHFSDAYLAMLQAGGVDVPRLLRENAWVAPLVHAEADYLGPMRFGDAISVEVVRTKVGETSYSVGYRTRSADGKRTLAIGHTTHVIVDGTTFKPKKIPDDVRRALFEGVLRERPR